MSRTGEVLVSQKTHPEARYNAYKKKLLLQVERHCVSSHAIDNLCSFLYLSDELFFGFLACQCKSVSSAYGPCHMNSRLRGARSSQPHPEHRPCSRHNAQNGRALPLLQHSCDFHISAPSRHRRRHYACLRPTSSALVFRRTQVRFYCYALPLAFRGDCAYAREVFTSAATYGTC